MAKENNTYILIKTFLSPFWALMDQCLVIV